MTFRVRLTKDAEADLEHRITALAERSPKAALRLNECFETSLFRLRDFPLSCGLAHESPRFTEELRHLLFGTHPKRRYRAIFVVRRYEVWVLAIRAPGERPVRAYEVAG